MSASLPHVLVPRERPLSLGQTVVRSVSVGLLALALLGLGWTLSFLLAPVVLGFVIFYSLNPIVYWLEHRELSRRAAVLLCFGALNVLVLIALALIWPSLDAWLQEAPLPGERSIFEVQLEARLNDWQHWGQERFAGVDWVSVFDRVRHSLESHRRRWMETLPLLASQALSSAGIYFLAPVIALFLLLDGARLHRQIVALVPNRYFETVLVLIHRVDRQIAAYLRGAATQALVVSLLMAATLWAGGMPNATLFGFVFGILNVIPLVGPVLGTLAGLLYSLVDASAPGIPVLLTCYFGVHLVDLIFITPWVVGRSVNLHPLMVVMGLTIGGTLAGILGMLVSVPLLAVIRAIVSTLYESYRPDGAV